VIVHPAYALFCVPPGHEAVVMLSGPPDAATVTVAVEVFEPAELVAVSV
jgi:hypothetical protein